MVIKPSHAVRKDVRVLYPRRAATTKQRAEIVVEMTEEKSVILSTLILRGEHIIFSRL